MFFVCIVKISICLENENPAVGDAVGLERIRRLWESEYLRGSLIISLRVQKMSGDELVGKL